MNRPSNPASSIKNNSPETERLEGKCPCFSHNEDDTEIQMSAKTPQETEILLRKLSSGKVTLREEALLEVASHERENRELVGAHQNVDKLFKILLTDLDYASGEMRKNPFNQFWGRTTIRTLAAAIEGVIFGLKQLALASAPLVGKRLTEDEMDFLREQQLSLQGRKVRWPGFRENFKRTFNLFAKTFGISCPTDFTQPGFEALCETFELRNRITHPKSFMTFCVQDGERNRAAIASEWFGRQFSTLLDVSKATLNPKVVTDHNAQTGEK